MKTSLALVRVAIPLCCVPLACSGLRHDRLGDRSGLAPSTVKPEGRHIQYLGNTYGSGMGDRIGALNWLVDLGIWWNATIHIKGGPTGTAEYLAGKHSHVINPNWSHYMDIQGACGVTPFNEVEDFEGCEIIDDPEVDFNSSLFSSGRLASGCVNIMQKWPVYKRRGVWLEKSRRCDIFSKGLAPSVYEASRKIMEKHSVPVQFGAYHIRRCDRLSTNAVCTEPSVVRKVLENNTDIGTWLIFTYAEPGYAAKLKEELATPSLSHIKLVYEEEMDLNPYHDGDNYFAFLVANDLILLRAARKIETTYCANGVGRVKERTTPVGTWAMFRPTEGEGSESEDVQLGVCGGESDQPHAPATA